MVELAYWNGSCSGFFGNVVQRTGLKALEGMEDILARDYNSLPTCTIKS